MLQFLIFLDWSSERTLFCSVMRLRHGIALDDEKQQKQTQPTQLITHNHTNLPLLTVSSPSAVAHGQQASHRAYCAIFPQRGRAHLESKKERR